MHGAIQESCHVFIEAGLAALSDRSSISVFEMGFGTGLNALLSEIYARKHEVKITYCSIEKYPLPLELIEQLNYCEILDCDENMLLDLHNWSKQEIKSDSFYLEKYAVDLADFQHSTSYDLIFFDAFGPGAHPAAWATTSLQPLYDRLNENGLLVTFCAQGQFKRNLRSVGFEVEAIPGPPGKREMTRAWKR